MWNDFGGSVLVYSISCHRADCAAYKVEIPGIRFWRLFFRFPCKSWRFIVWNVYNTVHDRKHFQEINTKGNLKYPILHLFAIVFVRESHCFGSVYAMCLYGGFNRYTTVTAGQCFLSTIFVPQSCLFRLDFLIFYYSNDVFVSVLMPMNHIAI